MGVVGLGNFRILTDYSKEIPRRSTYQLQSMEQITERERERETREGQAMEACTYSTSGYPLCCEWYDSEIVCDRS